MKRFALVLFLAACGFLPIRPAAAHIGDMFNSVHFNSGSPDFGQLPRRALLPTETEIRASFDGWGQDDDQGTWKAELGGAAEQARDAFRQARENSLRSQARKLEAKRHWAAARDVYVRLAAHDGWTGDLRDRVSVLSEIQNGPEPISTSALLAYMTAMDCARESGVERWPDARKLFTKISSDPMDRLLLSHAQYQIASLDVAWLDFHGAILRYKKLLHDFPKSNKREDALIMLARAAILPEAEDIDVSEARGAVFELLREYPNTRFRASARGLLARADYIDGHYARALKTYLSLEDVNSVEAVLRHMRGKEKDPVYPTLLAAYLRRLARADNYTQYAQAVEGIRDTIAVLTPVGAREFVAQLRREPSLSAPYFYYRLYHCDSSDADRMRLARLAQSLASSDRPNSLPSVVEARFAEVFYNSKRYREALRWANRASADSRPKLFDRAEFVAGATLYKLGLYHKAQMRFASLLTDAPQSPLGFAAREELALCCEADNDLASALDQYFLLGYKPDVAFLIDARMTLPQLEAYSAGCRDKERHALLEYSLGVRYLRTERWGLARAKFQSLPARALQEFWNPGRDPNGGGYYGFDDDPQDPLKTMADLSCLQAAARRPGLCNNAQASALYRYASYYYTHGTLLLYNYAVWQGERASSFDFWWNNAVATSADIDAARRHMYEHEVYARAEAICREIAADYPDSPAAPYALYRGGCAASKLGNFNGWWRGELRHHDHYLEAANMMSRLAHRYPRHPLAAEARKFAHVFADDSEAMVQERRDIAKAEKENKTTYRHQEPGWFP